jgi:hypothetical protein
VTEPLSGKVSSIHNDRSFSSLSLSWIVFLFTNRVSKHVPVWLLFGHETHSGHQSSPQDAISLYLHQASSFQEASHHVMSAGGRFQHEGFYFQILIIAARLIRPCATVSRRTKRPKFVTGDYWPLAFASKS